MTSIIMARSNQKMTHEATRLQVHSKNFNVNFTNLGNEVHFNNVVWSEFKRESSCEECHPEDIFVTVNPGYLQVPNN